MATSTCLYLIRHQYYDRLTNRFYREHQNQGKGAGLGLSLVKSIVDFHHGELQFSQSSLGGLAIRVSIPKSQV
jgi:signal transduction histidine kinase